MLKSRFWYQFAHVDLSQIVIGILLVTLALVTSQPAGAILISQGHPVFGTDSITLDSDTGLKWLDVDLTTGMSREVMIAELQTGISFPGFRYATDTEVFGLFTNAGIPDVRGTSAANISPAQNLMDLIGHTRTQFGIGDGREVIAQIATGQSIAFDGFFIGGTPTMSADYGPTYGINASIGTVAHWLVVPEPTAWFLVLIAFSLPMTKLREREQAEPDSPTASRCA